MVSLAERTFLNSPQLMDCSETSASTDTMYSVIVAFAILVLSFVYLKLFRDDLTHPFRLIAAKLQSFRSGSGWELSPRSRLLPRATKAALTSITGTGVGLWSRLYARIFHPDELAEEEDDEKYQAGEAYGDPKVLATSLIKDLRALGVKGRRSDLRTLIEMVKNKGKPMDDRQMHVSYLELIRTSFPCSTNNEH